MTEKMAILQGEAEKVAGRALVPVLMAGGAMEFGDWRGARAAVGEMRASADRPLRGKVGEPDTAMMANDKAEWTQWRERHKDDLFLSFCVALPEPDMVAVADGAIVLGPLTMEQLREFVGATKIRALRGVSDEVASAFASQIVSIAPPTFGQIFSGWLRFWSICVAILVAAYVLFPGELDSVDYFYLVCFGFFAFLALVVTVLRSRGPS